MSIVVPKYRLGGVAFKPYIAEASLPCWLNLVITCSRVLPLPAYRFYAPQGRKLVALTFENLPDRFANLESPFGRFANFEMETAGYALATMLGHQMVGLNALIANRATGAFSSVMKRLWSV